jgi:transcriptional regulator with XRE-family HTH domain
MPQRPIDERPSRVFKKSQAYLTVTENLGKRIRQLREDRGWTLEQASEAMHIDLKHLQKIEAGQLNVTLVTLVRVAEGFCVPIAILFSREAL